MEVKFILNGKQACVEAAGDTILLDVLRELGCHSVKCGCETTNCGLCTVWIDGKSRLSCSILAASIERAGSDNTGRGKRRSRGVWNIFGK